MGGDNHVTRRAYDKVVAEKDTLKENNKDKTLEIKELKKQRYTANTEMKELKATNKAQELEIKDLNTALADVNDKLLALRARKGARVSTKVEQKEDVVKAIWDFMKDIGWRTFKWAPTEKHLHDITKKVFAYIKDDLSLDKGPVALDESEFVRIYAGAVQSKLAQARQYAQSRGCKAAASTYPACIFV